MNELMVCYRCLKVTPRDKLVDKYVKPLKRIVNKSACPKCKCMVFMK